MRKSVLKTDTQKITPSPGNVFQNREIIRYTRFAVKKLS